MKTANNHRPYFTFTSILGLLLLCLVCLPAADAQQLLLRAVKTYRVGSYPKGMAFDGANIWVTASNGTDLTELRASDGATLGNFPAGGLSQDATFDGTYVWVLIGESGYTGVTRLRPADGSIEGSYSIGPYFPERILFDGENIWVGTGEATVIKLRGSDAAVLGTYTVNSGEMPVFGLAFDGANIWATNYGLNTVTKLRASDGAIQGTFPVGSYPVSAAFDGTNIWVANALDNTLTKLRASDGALLNTVRVGEAPSALLFDSRHIWVTNTNDNTVMRLDPKRGTILRTYTTGQVPYNLVFDETNIWVSDFRNRGLVNKITPAQR